MCCWFRFNIWLKDEPDEGVSNEEDLMREHSILNRELPIFNIYRMHKS